jgi:hypothetical protein
MRKLTTSAIGLLLITPVSCSGSDDSNDDSPGVGTTGTVNVDGNNAGHGGTSSVVFSVMPPSRGGTSGTHRTTTQPIFPVLPTGGTTSIRTTHTAYPIMAPAGGTTGRGGTTSTGGTTSQGTTTQRIFPVMPPRGGAPSTGGTTGTTETTYVIYPILPETQASLRSQAGTQTDDDSWWQLAESSLNRT